MCSNVLLAPDLILASEILDRVRKWEGVRNAFVQEAARELSVR